MRKKIIVRIISYILIAVVHIVLILALCPMVCEAGLPQLSIDFELTVERKVVVPGVGESWEKGQEIFCLGICAIQFCSNEQRRVKIKIDRPMNLYGTLKLKGPSGNDGISWGRKNVEAAIEYVPAVPMTSGLYTMERIIEGAEQATFGSFQIYRFDDRTSGENISLSQCGREPLHPRVRIKHTHRLFSWFAPKYCASGNAPDVISLCVESPTKYKCVRRELSASEIMLQFRVLERGPYRLLAWFKSGTSAKFHFTGF